MRTLSRMNERHFWRQVRHCKMCRALAGLYLLVFTMCIPFVARFSSQNSDVPLLSQVTKVHLSGPPLEHPPVIA